MNGRFFTGVLLAALAAFVWGALFWLNPLPTTLMKQTADDEAIQELLREHFDESGIYFIPGPGNDAETLERLATRGPVASVFIQLEGQTPMQFRPFMAGLAHSVVSTFLLGLLMLMARRALPSYGNRVSFAALAGMAGAFFAFLINPVWFSQPWGWHLLLALYMVTGWIVAGLVLAAFIGPRAAGRR